MGRKDINGITKLIESFHKFMVAQDKANKLVEKELEELKLQVTVINKWRNKL